ncbi:MAG: hypothetical protein CL846_00805 [Crocinitomicaceae bacterium]|nr:hypothetical protein [Crocinitomicaceae bacterium]|tara:strand:+ start:3104 stop:4834 length:1731 start_codon:yes stop_codon:yes gene_type:complete
MKNIYYVLIIFLLSSCWASSSFVKKEKWEEMHTAKIKIMDNSYPTPSFTNKKGETIIPTKTETNSDSKVYKFYIEKLYKKNLNINVNSEMFEDFSLEIKRKTRPGVLTIDVLSSVWVLGMPFLAGHFINTKIYKLDNSEYTFSPKTSEEFYAAQLNKLKLNPNSKKENFDRYILKYPDSPFIEEASETALHLFYKENISKQSTYIDLVKFTKDIKTQEKKYGSKISDENWSSIDSKKQEKLSSLRTKMLREIQNNKTESNFWNIISNFNNHSYEIEFQDQNDMYDLLLKEIKKSNFNGEFLAWNENMENSSKTKLNFKNGKKDGEIRVYFYNNQIKKIENWAVGKREGITKIYYESGEIKRIEDWKFGRIDFKIGFQKNQLSNMEKYGDDLTKSKDHLLAVSKYKTAKKELKKLEKILSVNNETNNDINKLINIKSIDSKINSSIDKYAYSLLKKGNNSYNAKDYSKAIGFYNEFLEYKTDDISVKNKIKTCERKIEEENKKRIELNRKKAELRKNRTVSCNWCRSKYRYGDGCLSAKNPGYPFFSDKPCDQNQCDWGGGDYCSFKCAVEACYNDQ